MATQDSIDKIINIRFNYKELVQGWVKANEAIEDNKKILADLKKEYETGQISLSDYKKAQLELKSTTKALTDEQRQYEKEIQNNIKVEKELDGSLNQLRANLNGLIAQYGRLSAAERESEDIKNAALMRYKAEIKRIKALVFAADAELMANGAETAKDKRKQALVAALKEMLNFDETALTVEQAGEKAEALTEFLRGGRRPEDDSYFDLDEVLNPKEELDLEALCRELGVME